MNLAMRLATGTMLSLALVSVPASARGYRGHDGHHGHYRHHGGGIGTFGGFLLGAAVLGTVAAIASAPRERALGYAPQPYGGYTGDRGYDDQYARNEPGAYNDDDANEPTGYDQQAAGDPVEDCSRAAERQAQRGGGLARVIGIDRVDNIAGGASVHGRLEIDAGQSAPLRSLKFRCYASNGAVMSLRLG